jgi:hypothetical protein
MLQETKIIFGAGLSLVGCIAMVGNSRATSITPSINITINGMPNSGNYDLNVASKETLYDPALGATADLTYAVSGSSYGLSFTKSGNAFGGIAIMPQAPQLSAGSYSLLIPAESLYNGLVNIAKSYVQSIDTSNTIITSATIAVSHFNYSFGGLYQNPSITSSPGVALGLSNSIASSAISHSQTFAQVVDSGAAPPYSSGGQSPVTESQMSQDIQSLFAGTSIVGKVSGVLIPYNFSQTYNGHSFNWRMVIDLTDPSSLQSLDVPYVSNSLGSPLGTSETLVNFTNATSGGTADLSMVATPEPASLLIFLVGLGGLALLQRRSRRMAARL